MRRSFLIGWSVAIASIGFLSFFLVRYNPGGILAPCPLRSLTGVPCPTCGGTAAMRGLFSGELRGAWLANPLVVLVGLTLFGSGVAAWVMLPWADRIDLDRLPGLRFGLLLLLALALLNWAYLIVSR